MRVFIALILLASVGFADSAGKYGNGRTQPRVTVETRIITTQNQLQVRFTSGGDSSAWLNASEDPDGDGRDALDSAESGNTGGEEFRFNGGNAQYKNGQGHWIDLGRKRKGNPAPNDGSQYITAGSPIPGDGFARPVGDSRWFPVTAGSTFNFDIYYLPGDDITTLPDGPDYD